MPPGVNILKAEKNKAAVALRRIRNGSRASSRRRCGRSVTIFEDGGDQEGADANADVDKLVVAFRKFAGR